MATVASAGEDAGQLVFQKSKRLHGECYIISIYDNAAAGCVRFSAFDLESAETYNLSYSYSEFDALFQAQADQEFADTAKKDARYNWVLERLSLASEIGGANKHLILETAADDGEATLRPPSSQQARSPMGPPSSRPRPQPRLSYAQRAKQKREAEQLEAKRAANAALRHDRNRKAFVAELMEKRKLEEMRDAVRRQRTEEERAERRERAEVERALQQAKQERYHENDRKREKKIQALESARKVSEQAAIQEILSRARAAAEAKAQRLEEARQRKHNREAAEAAEEVQKKASQEELEAKREARIAERNERVKNAEKEYLRQRRQQICRLEIEQEEKEAKKRAHIRERAAVRAAQLRLKQEKIEAWERANYIRTQNNMRKETARNAVMVDHIESLRQKYSQEVAEATSRKQEALEERKAQEAKDALTAEAEQRRLQELNLKREQSIAAKEAARRERSQRYIEDIRNRRTSDVLKAKDGQDLLEVAKARTREERAKAYQESSQRALAAAETAARREENIRRRERERDLRFASEVHRAKEQQLHQSLDAEGRRAERQLQEREEAAKRRQEASQKQRRTEELEGKRDEAIQQREEERHQREQARWQTGGAVTEEEVAKATSEAKSKTATNTAGMDDA